MKSITALFLIVFTLYSPLIDAEEVKPTKSTIVHPEWYLIFTYQTLRAVPGKVLFFSGEAVVIFGFLIAVAFWIFVPFLDRKSQQGIASKLFTIIGVIVSLYIVIMSFIAYLA